MDEKERTQFLNNLRAKVQEYKKTCKMDEKSKEDFDAKKIRKDWENVGNYIQSSIEKTKEQYEK